MGRAEPLLVTALSRPRLTLVGGFLTAWIAEGVSFGCVVASFPLTLLGPTFKLPGWAPGISPFYRVPDLSEGASLRGDCRCISRGVPVACGRVRGVPEPGRGIINKVMEIGAPSRNRTRDTRGRNPLL